MAECYLSSGSLSPIKDKRASYSVTTSLSSHLPIDSVVAATSQSLPKDIGEVLQRFTLLRSICDLDPRSGASVKLDRIVEILQAVKEAGEKAVVFSYLLCPLDVLAKRLARKHPPIGAVSLTGELTTDERGRVIQNFKSDERVVALLCSSSFDEDCFFYEKPPCLGDWARGFFGSLRFQGSPRPDSDNNLNSVSW